MSNNAVHKFNGLNGTVVSREEIARLIELAKDQEQPEVAARLEKVLSNFDHEQFQINLQSQAIECVPASLLPLLDEAPELPEENANGLNKPVSPDEIYTMITNKMIEFIKEAKKSDYKKKWSEKKYGKGYLIPFNFASKKRYRGVNFFMLRNFDKPLENPFFLTFKQVDAVGGKVKKGSEGHEVVYFTRLYTYSQDEPKLEFGTYDKKKFETWFAQNKHLIPEREHKKDHAIPILKYYKVFNGKDIEGIDFDLDNFKVGYIESEMPPDEPMPAADAIVENFPTPKVPIGHGGDRAYYSPGADRIQMPHKADFDTAQDYYRTLFHELGHATGSPKRLNRDLSGRFGSKKYAFEELIAEFNAVFVSAEAGFLWHTNKNHAGYLKGWNEVLTHVKDDNRFVMRAASQAQKATDYILQPDADGNPKYLKTLKVETPKKENKSKANLPKPKKSKTTAKPKKTKAELEAANPKPVAKKPKSIAVATVIRNILSLDKYKGKANERQAAILYKHFKDNPVSETPVEIMSDYERGVMRKESDLYNFYMDTDYLELTDLGTEFVKSMVNRRESLVNQKHNFALFDGLKGKATPTKKELVTHLNSQPIERFANDAAYILGADLDRLMARVDDNKAARDRATNEVVDTILSSEHLEMYLKEIGYNIPPKRKVKKKGLKGYVPKNPTINEAIQYAENYLIGKSIYHQDIDKKILFTAAGIKKAIQGKTKPTRTRIQLVFIAKDLVKKARLFETKKDKKGRNDVIAYHTLRTTITLDGKRFEVIIKIQEKKNGSLYYDHTGVELKKQINVPGEKSEPLGRVNLLSSPKGKNKGTKKSNTTKKGLKSPAPIEETKEATITLQPEPQQPAQQDRGGQVAPDAPVNANKLKDFGFVSADQVPDKPEGIFRLPGEIGEFIQDLQPYQELIIVKGPPHSSKSQLVMQLANAFGEINMKVAYIDGEQGGIKSKDTIDSRNRNTTPTGQKNIFITGELDCPYEDLKKIAKECDVIAADSVTELGLTAVQLNKFRKEHPEIIWIFISQVKEGGQMYGGNKMAHNPTKIIHCEPDHDYTNRIAILEKNRGNSLDPKYNIFHKQLIKDELDTQPNPVVDSDFCITEVH